MTAIAKVAEAEARAAQHEIRIAEELDRERVKREARRRLAAEERGPVAAPALVTLREQLARPRRIIRYRLGRWQPTSSRVLLAAQFKAGKSTLVGNYLRCLVDGERWLGVDEVVQLPGKVALLDFEMSASQLVEWLRAQGIRNDDQVLVIPMRGQGAAFDILNPLVRAQWAARLREHDVANLALDCLRPVMDALGLDEHRDGGRFLTCFDALLHEAGIGESLVVHHMGHLGERSRGDSRFRDWPDVEWRLVRETDEPNSPRFLSAYGRDVDVPESALAYDPATRRLTIAGGSRKQTQTDEALEAVLVALTESSAPLSVRGIQAALSASDHARDIIRAAIKAGVTSGAIVTEPGPKGAIWHRSSGLVCERAAACGERAAHSASECAAAYIEPHARTLLTEDSEQKTVRTLKGQPFSFDGEAFGANRPHHTPTVKNDGDRV